MGIIFALSVQKAQQVCSLLYVDDSRNIFNVMVAVLRAYEPFLEFPKFWRLRKARVARISLTRLIKKLCSFGVPAVNINLVKLLILMEDFKNCHRKVVTS